MDATLVKQYLLVTPVKDEEKNFENLLKSIIDQTIKPTLWVVVDDGSSDHTPDMIVSAKDKYGWIKSIRLEENSRDRGVHLANVIKVGFDFAFKYCQENKIHFDYLGNVDADVVFEDTYFENLMGKFEIYPTLGVASGGLWILENEKTVKIENIYPDGGDILYRKKCFEQCKGVPLFGLWDSVLNAKARMGGWEIRRFNDCKAVITRGYCQRGTLWKQYVKIGENYYLMNYHYLHTLLKCLRLCSKKPYYSGLFFLWGYFFNLIMRKEQILDEEVKKYFWYIHPKETKTYYIKKFKNKFKTKID